jgi:hypothetical protein
MTGPARIHAVQLVANASFKGTLLGTPEGRAAI